MDDRCCSVFHALSDKTRLKILNLLRRGECCVSEIGKHFDMTQPSISHHLDILKRAGLVTHEKRGREVYYALSAGTIVDCCGSQLEGLDIEIRKK